MTALLRSRRWTVVLAATALALVGAAAKGWWTFGLTDMFEFRPPFADTVAILAAGEARQAGADIYAIPMRYDPLGRPHVYGPGWLVTGALGLTTRDSVWIGTLLAVVFILSAAVVLRPRAVKETGLGLLLLCSPPMMLGVSRGNNDLVIFLLLAAGCFFLAVPRAAGAVVGALSLAVAAVLKLYPLAALPVIVLRPTRPARALSALGATLVGCAVVIWAWRTDFRQAMHLAPDPRTTMAYGVKVISMTWQDLVGRRSAVIAGWLAGTALAITALWPSRRALLRLPTAPSFSVIAYAAGAVCWVFCFATVRSFPYRFVLLLLPARLLLELDGEAGISGRMQVLWWAIVGWCDPVKMMWAERARLDPAMNSRDWQIFEVIIGIEQGLTVVLTLALLAGLLGIFARCVTAWRRTEYSAPSSG